jgi:hypothetical protein
MMEKYQETINWHDDLEEIKINTNVELIFQKSYFF